MVGGILTWVVIALAVGHGSALRLLTALMLMRAVRTFTALDIKPALRRRETADRSVYLTSRRKAWQIEALTLLAAAILLAIILFILDEIGKVGTGRLLALLAIGLPARSLLLLGRGRERDGALRITLSASGLALASLVLLFKPDTTAVAVALAAREWVAAGILLLPPLRASRRTNSQRRDVPLTFGEIAAITGRRARHRLVYRVGKSLLGFLGPAGGVLARTGRSMRVHRRVGPLTSRSSIPIVILAGAATTAAVIIPIIFARPATMLLAASCLRIGAAAGNALLWWRFVDDGEADEDDDED